MKKTIFLLLLFLGGCSFAAFHEKYQQTPASARSVGEGKDVYTYDEAGKTYLLQKGADGKYYVIGEKP